jgi:hypothetical protein
MTQKSLFPVKLVHEEETIGTRDLRLIAYSDSGTKYAVKRESDGALLPLAEWIGHKLSQACGIPTPMYDIVECIDGELAFGSRWDNSAVQMTGYDAAAKTLLSSHAEAISKIFGLDYFLPNPDRHLGNFLFAPKSGHHECLSFDFSLSCVRNGLPFGSHPLGTSCRTHIVLKRFLVDDLKKFNKHKYNEALASVKVMTDNDILTILDSAPVAWYTSVSKADILSWWRASKATRILQVTK